MIKHYVNKRFLQILPDPDSPNAQRRNATRELDERRTTKGMLRRALKIYDLKKGFNPLSSDDVSTLEKIFGVDDMKWPSEEDGPTMIHHKIHNVLQSLLKMHGVIVQLKHIRYILIILMSLKISQYLSLRCSR